MAKTYLDEEARMNQRMRPYNVLDGENRRFAKRVGVSVGEYTVRAKGVRKARKTDPLSMVAGCGNFGFSTKRPKRDDAKFVQTIDGTGLKKDRHSAAKPRKMVCRLATSAEVHIASTDPDVLRERAAVTRKFKRSKNRNRKAKYGRKLVA